ncbi:MAG: TatD family hydrolase [Actinomycetota bacterium]|nr:TatD family hydrolase [Actinomycetota bacterium]
MTPDTHCHLELVSEASGIPIPEIISTAKKDEVCPLITVGIDIPSSRGAIAISSRFKEVFASAGIHPNGCSSCTEEHFHKLEEMCTSKNVVAVGETGLDYYRSASTKDEQERAFRRQISIAKKCKKTLIIHSREAHSKVLEILEEEDTTGIGVIMHCFSGDEDFLRECLLRDYFISFAGPITFKKSVDTRRLASLVPLESVLAETDAPFLSPEPFRGKTNFPQRVKLVAAELGRIYSLPPTRMSEILLQNTSRAFKISQVLEIDNG